MISSTLKEERNPPENDNLSCTYLHIWCKISKIRSRARLPEYYVTIKNLLFQCFLWTIHSVKNTHCDSLNFPWFLCGFFFLVGILLCTAGQNIALDTNGGLSSLRFHVASVKSRMTGASVADQKGRHITFHGYLDVVFLLGVINHLVIVGEL